MPTHLFHRDAMRNAIKCMIIDFFDFHASLYGNEKISSQYADLYHFSSPAYFTVTYRNIWA